MDRIWQLAWDRYGTRYSWAVFAIGFLLVLPVYLLVSFLLVTLLVQAYVFLPPGGCGIRLAEQWAAGHEVDLAKALDATYAYARGAAVRSVGGNAVVSAAMMVLVGSIAGAGVSRLSSTGSSERPQTFPWR
jgi:hypothetical protein